MLNQRNRVLNLLKSVGSKGMFTWEFFDLVPAILRPASRVDELRKMGHKIKTTKMNKGGYKYILEES